MQTEEEGSSIFQGNSEQSWQKNQKRGEEKHIRIHLGAKSLAIMLISPLNIEER